MTVLNNNRFHNEEDYNCATYAFNLPDGGFKLFNCFDDHYLIELHEDGYTEDRIYETILENLTYEILDGQYPEHIRQVKTLEDIQNIKDDEELIQMRIRLDYSHGLRPSCGKIGDCNDSCIGCLESHYVDKQYCIGGDFHFRVFRNGKWMEKCGATEIQECEPWNDDFGHHANDFNGSSDNGYLSPTVLFINKVIQI